MWGSGSEGPVHAEDQADTCLPEDPPQYKHITGMPLLTRHRSHWAANQDHVAERERGREKSSLAQHRKHTQLENRQWIKFNYPHMYAFHACPSYTHLSPATQWPKFQSFSQAGNGPLGVVTPLAPSAIATHSQATAMPHTLMDDLQIRCEVRDLVVCSAGSL